MTQQRVLYVYSVSKQVLEDEGVRVEKRLSSPVRHAKMPKSPPTAPKALTHAARPLPHAPFHKRARPIGQQSLLMTKRFAADALKEYFSDDEWNMCFQCKRVAPQGH